MMAATIPMQFVDGRGRRVTREIQQTLDVRDFIGTRGYSLLVIAANRHLSASDIHLFLHQQEKNTPFVERSLTYVYKRRKNFRPPDKNAIRRASSSPDYARAVRLMRARPKWSVRDLAALLKDEGIVRGREWVRNHRCDPLV